MDRSTLKTWLGYPSTVVAIVLVVLGLIFVSLEAQSQNWVYYTGEHVTGTVDGGIVYYQVHGEQYTVDDTRVPQPADGTKIGVYYQQGDPSAVLLDQPVRWIELAGMLVWFVAAALLLLGAGLRRAHDRRRRPAEAADDAHWWPTRAQDSR
ncbi:MAG TPA: hypothetical protein VFL69_02240 [Marmoricola sp.]|nr:hypothetical protein [Marmoricola sp.]